MEFRYKRAGTAWTWERPSVTDVARLATKKLTCKTTCSGYTQCSPNPDGNGCTLGLKPPSCVSGFSAGNAGGAVIY